MPMRMLTRAFTAHMCDKYLTIVYWLTHVLDFYRDITSELLILYNSSLSNPGLFCLYMIAVQCSLVI